MTSFLNKMVFTGDPPPTRNHELFIEVYRSNQGSTKVGIQELCITIEEGGAMLGSGNILDIQIILARALQSLNYHWFLGVMQIFLWWGVFVASTSRSKVREWLVIHGPRFLTLLLLFVGGIPLLEVKNQPIRSLAIDRNMCSIKEQRGHHFALIPSKLSVQIRRNVKYYILLFRFFCNPLIPSPPFVYDKTKPALVQSCFPFRSSPFIVDLHQGEMLNWYRKDQRQASKELKMG
ncbi:hypothetical protein IFM89_000392 [Coptis chinensis]|uniref:Uncharacterized protein n=1 Tax=Coptis chinensis TaxID=261450 RepID=A0A835HBK6_9MAGN|nr:hypothetical protein IFM89_000392 [Coptis chinensis]